MNFKLKVWRQKDRSSKGKLIAYEARDISPDTSFLEMLDIVNEQLLGRGEEPIAFDSDCREGICGTCSLNINGEAHGPDHPGAACELYMRKFRDGARIVVEPFRARTFPVIKDLVVDRSALDRIVQAGGFISARARARRRKQTRSRSRNTMPISRWKRRPASVAARARPRVRMHRPCCLPRRKFRISLCCRRAKRNATDACLRMVQAMDAEGFGNCTNTYECEAVCPAEISASFIAKLNREYARAKLRKGAGE